MYKGIFVSSFFLFFLLNAFVASAQTSCLAFPSGSVAPSGYGTSWDVFDAGKRLLIKADCTLNADGKLPITIGAGDQSQYVYKSVYSYKGPVEKWRLHTLTGENPNGDWFIGSATYPNGLIIPDETSATNPYYFVGYVCTNRSGSWKCGCSDSTCAAPHWQLQGYRPPASSGGGTGGGNTGATAGFPEIKECGSTQNVSGGSLSSAASADGCRTIIAAAGSYGSLLLTGHTGGVVTIKCATPGACTMGNGSKIVDSDGVIFDGFKIAGGSEGLRIEDSNNVLVRNSTFTEQTNSGVLLFPGNTKENIQVYDNTFKNDKTGCHINNDNQCGSLSDGSPIANMDYGVRIYDAKSVAVRGNTFSSLSNHWVSLKYGVKYALIEDNTFSGCGRVCIQLGQEVTGTESVEAMVRNNRFSGKVTVAVWASRIQKVTITGNTYNLSSGSKFRADPSVKPAGERVIINNDQ